MVNLGPLYRPVICVIFIGTAKSVENSIGAWLEAMQEDGEQIEIVSVTQSESNGMITITILAR